MKKIVKNKKNINFGWINPELEIRNTNKYGKDIFAKKNIKPKELLSIFGGYVMTLREEANLPKDYSDTGIQIAENFVITSANKKENIDYFNHSCDPNAGINGQIFLVAMRNIKKGEQIVFDYAMVLSKAKNARFYKMKCLCGSKNCRGYITDNDWKKSVLQKKYDGYFQWYLQEKINILKNNDGSRND